jgi:hypothetical protein
MRGQLRCEPRRPTVQAATHGGDAAEVLAWVLAASLDPSVTGQCVGDGAVVVLEHIHGSTRQTVIWPGDVVVQAPGGRYGWDACDASTFRCSYAVAPRELPVFDDGEVV